MLEALAALVEYIAPTPKTHEQVMQESRDDVKLEARALRKKQLRNELEQEDAAKAFERATAKKDKRAARLQAEKTVRLEREAATLDLESDRLGLTEHRVDKIVRDQKQQQAVVVAMAYSNTKSINPTRVGTIATQYTMSKDATKMANDAVSDALANSSEELDQEQRQQYTVEEQRRLDELMGDYTRSVNRQLMEEMPAIEGVHVSQVMAHMTADEMARKSQADAKLLQEHLARVK